MEYEYFLKIALAKLQYAQATDKFFDKDKYRWLLDEKLIRMFCNQIPEFRAYEDTNYKPHLLGIKVITSFDFLLEYNANDVKLFKEVY